MYAACQAAPLEWLLCLEKPIVDTRVLLKVSQKRWSQGGFRGSREARLLVWDWEGDLFDVETDCGECIGVFFFFRDRKQQRQVAPGKELVVE